MSTATKNEKIISERLRELRIAQGMTQGELAEYAGIDRKTVNRIENGHFSPNLDTMFRLCAALSISPVRLFQGIK